MIRRIKHAINKRRRAVRSLEIGIHDLIKVQRETLRLQLLSQPRHQEQKRLIPHGFKVFSQYEEDGILAEIFKRIGNGDRTFVEIGTGNGTETNSTFLLMQGWSGAWIEASQADMEYARRFSEYYPVKTVNSFVTRENVDGIVRAQVPSGQELSLLSIDVDYNDYWLWEAVTVQPRAVIIEYNATIPPTVAATVAYDPNAAWQGSAYFGASLAALEALGRKKGYALVGCTLEGLNAFFVRDDLVGEHFCAPFTAQNYYEPPRYWLAPPAGHFAGFGKWELIDFPEPDVVVASSEFRRSTYR